MPISSGPNENPGSALSDNGNSSASLGSSAASPGSPVNRALVEVLQCNFLRLLNEHGFPQEEFQDAAIDNLIVNTSMYLSPYVSFSASGGILTIGSSGLQLTNLSGRVNLSSGTATVNTAL